MQAISGQNHCIKTPVGSKNLCWTHTRCFFGGSVMLSTSTVVRFRCVWSSGRNLRTNTALLEDGGLVAFGNVWRTVGTNILLGTISIWQYVYLFLAPSEKSCANACLRRNLSLNDTYSCINMNLYISANLARRVHWQYLAILNPSFMRGRGENNQLKIFQLPVCDKRLSLICSEADLLAFQQGQCQGLGLCSEPSGVLFPLSRREVCFYLRTKVVGCRQYKQQSLLEKLCTGPSSGEMWY